jgi:hypothetical protein
MIEKISMRQIYSMRSLELVKEGSRMEGTLDFDSLDIGAKF